MEGTHMILTTPPPPPVVEVVWAMPDGGTPSNVTWDQPLYTDECGGWNQVDSYTPTDVPALTADGYLRLVDGQPEDHAVVISWRFEEQPPCIETPITPTPAPSVTPTETPTSEPKSPEPEPTSTQPAAIPTTTPSPPPTADSSAPSVQPTDTTSPTAEVADVANLAETGSDGWLIGALALAVVALGTQATRFARSRRVTK